MKRCHPAQMLHRASTPHVWVSVAYMATHAHTQLQPYPVGNADGHRFQLLGRHQAQLEVPQRVGTVPNAYRNIDTLEVQKRPTQHKPGGYWCMHLCNACPRTDMCRHEQVQATRPAPTPTAHATSGARRTPAYHRTSGCWQHTCGSRPPSQARPPTAPFHLESTRGIARVWSPL